jgi:hypothetical protein
VGQRHALPSRKPPRRTGLAPAIDRFLVVAALLGVAFPIYGAPIPFDGSGLHPGPVTVTLAADSLTVQWNDERGRPWRAEFSLEPTHALITTIGVAGREPVVRDAAPMYDGEFGKRRGGWDEFFDQPPAAPEGTRHFGGALQRTAARAVTVGDRLDLIFDSFQMGLFHGSMGFTFFPGSRLIQVFALVSTQEQDVAYYYNAGMTLREPARAGDVMDTQVSYYDISGAFQTIRSTGPERIPLKVRYRALTIRTPGGAVTAFPPPHQYFMPRDFTTNLGFTWHFAWRGIAGIGIRQYPDDNSFFYPWMNAPPGTEQRLSAFFLLDDRDPKTALEDALRYTHADRFPKLDGFTTLAAHWHPDFTVQAMENGPDWVPPFKPVLKQMGVDSMLIFDYHLEGHPDSLDKVRLQELEALSKSSKAQSDAGFLIVPAEEANVWLGGHYGLIFPKPVHWFKQRPAGTPLRTTDPQYGTVWHVGSPEDMLEMIRAEGGYVYQAHPRTKDSKGYPDKIRDTAWFRDPRYFGTGWKALPADLSSPRLGERAFKVVDDVNNWGLHKLFISEVDVFQVDSTHELYGHMNVNYLRLAKLPDFDHYGDLLKAVVAGDSFMTTGEILLPLVSVSTTSAAQIAVQAKISWTFPLRMAEIVWGDGTKTDRKVIPLEQTHEFGNASFTWTAAGPGWKWARLAVWDVAGNGAFTQPVWK